MWRIRWRDTSLDRSFGRWFATQAEAKEAGKELVTSGEAISYSMRFINFPFEPKVLVSRYDEVEEYYGGDTGRILAWLNRWAVDD
jgi:hypothetical protein